MLKLVQTVLIVLGYLWGFSANALVVMDVFGVDAAESSALLKKYAKRIEAVVVPLNQAGLRYHPGDSLVSINRLLKRQRRLINTIKHTEGYAYVDFEEIVYPHGGLTHYVTVDVVKSNQPERLRWITEDTPHAAYPKTHDVLDQMNEFMNKSAHLMVTDPDAVGEEPCPVYHCFMGFAHPELKPYLALFNHSALKQQPFILHALAQDKNPARRAAAAFLVGHFTDPDFIIKTLLPHVSDPDSTVRNNSMRVISTTLAKVPSITVDPGPFIDVLNSPYVTDRNKSLFVLSELSRIPQLKPQIIAQGAERLLALFALKQPNQHDPAYLLTLRTDSLTSHVF